MTIQRAYKVVDVFTATPLRGNPVAVVLDAEDLNTATMQAIAGWTNLSETTFLLPPESPRADYRLRIFTPRTELIFAGHPTLGSAHAALEAGRATPRNGRLVQECGAGLISIGVDGDGPDRRMTLVLPTAKLRLLDLAEVEELEAILGVAVERTMHPTVVDVGPLWIVAQVADADAVLALQPNYVRMAALTSRMPATGVTVYGACDGGDTDVEVRSFAPGEGVNEDPVCGSGNGAVAVFRHTHAPASVADGRYRAAQGRCVGRSGRIELKIAADGTVYVGGRCVTTVDGRLVAA